VSPKRRKKTASGAARVHRDARGKAHLLVVARDPGGGPDRVALARPLFEAEWQNQVAAAAAATAHAMLTVGRTPEQAAALGRNAMAGTSKIVDGALAQAPERPPACRAGCAHCCHQPVGVTPPEVLAIVAHLQAIRAPAALEATTARMREADDRTRGVPTADRLSAEFPCPFLEDARCTIYEVRPLSCRGANSLDAAACERPLRDPAARAAFAVGTLAVPCYLEPIRAFHAVTAGMQLAAHELHGLAMLPLELTAAMRIALDDPDAVARAWLAGDDPFAPARGGDNTADPRLRALAGTREPAS
jgi:hypothetical protein